MAGRAAGEEECSYDNTTKCALYLLQQRNENLQQVEIRKEEDHLANYLVSTQDEAKEGGR